MNVKKIVERTGKECLVKNIERVYRGEDIVQILNPAYPEEWTPGSFRTRTSNIKRILKNNKTKEALSIILASKLDDSLKEEFEKTLKELGLV